MKTDDKKYVRDMANVHLLQIFPDNIERENVLSVLLPEVEQDIEETADEDFTLEDIRIAIARVLYKRIVKE